MTVTTTNTVEGHSIREYRGIVFGEVISGVNMFRDIGAGLTNLFGGRSAGYEDELQNARNEALSEMCRRAERTGANAVVGVRPEFMTVSEKGEGVAGKVYSTLPSGMETTVKIHYGDQIFTSVVFGGVDYAVNQPIHFSFRGKDILLFGKESGKRIGVGGIRLF